MSYASRADGRMTEQSKNHRLGRVVYPRAFLSRNLESGNMSGGKPPFPTCGSCKVPMAFITSRRTIARTVLVAILLVIPAAARAQSGVLIPSSTEKPNPSVLSLDEMSVNVLIDNQYARVRVTQIFGNRTDRIQEGRYVFLIPTTASISD